MKPKQTHNVAPRTEPRDVLREYEPSNPEQDAAVLMEAMAMGDLPGAVYLANRLVGVPEELTGGVSHTYSRIDRRARPFVRDHIGVVTERNRSALFGPPTHNNPNPDPVAIWEAASDKTSDEAIAAMQKAMLYAGRYVWGRTERPAVLGSDLRVRTVDYRGPRDTREGILRRYMGVLGYKRGAVSGSPILAWCDTHPGVGDQLRGMLMPQEGLENTLNTPGEKTRIQGWLSVALQCPLRQLPCFLRWAVWEM